MIARQLLIGMGLILFWQCIVSLFQLPDYILPTPKMVFSTLYLQKNVIFIHALPTLFETLVGFVLGILLGCSLGLLVAFFHPLRRWFLPVLIISQAIPTFAIAPLIVIWFGYGITSKITTTILMIFFPIASSFYDGLRNTQSAWLDLAKTMNATKWRVFYLIRIPAALPSLATGIRIAAVAAPIGAIIGEWVGASRGLGYLMLNANARLQIDLMFAALSIIILLSLLLYFSVDRVLRAWIWWDT